MKAQDLYDRQAAYGEISDARAWSQRYDMREPDEIAFLEAIAAAEVQP